jgi:hypothetical protein
MEKKFCSFCGLSLALKCDCGVNSKAELPEGFEKPESKYPEVNLMGLPDQEEVTKLAKEMLDVLEEKGHNPQNVIEAGLGGQTRGSSPPDEAELELRELERKRLEGPMRWVAPEPELCTLVPTREQLIEAYQDPDVKLGQVHDRRLMYAEVEDQLRAGKAVVRAIMSIPQDSEGGIPVAAVVTENYVEELVPHLSVRTPIKQPPIELRFAIPDTKLPASPESDHGDVTFESTKYVHVDSMPPELKAVVESYVRLTRDPHCMVFVDRKGLMEEFKDAIMQLAGSTASLGKKTG